MPCCPMLVTEMQLAAGPGLRMAGDDLLDKSSAGSRHTDDQHRRLIRAAEFRRPRDHVGCEVGNQAVDLNGERRRVERHKAPAHSVSSIEMLHSQGVVAKILR